MRTLSMWKASRVRTLKELDRIPAPAHIVQPVYLLELEKKGIVGTVICWSSILIRLGG